MKNKFATIIMSIIIILIIGIISIFGIILWEEIQQTVYQDLNGNEIKINDGNTFVNICPTNAKVDIEGVEENISENINTTVKEN